MSRHGPENGLRDISSQFAHAFRCENQVLAIGETG